MINLDGKVVAEFKQGGVYFCTSPCDSGCRWQFIVVRRTASSVWVRELGADGREGATTRRKVSVWGDSETVLPFGSYSMAPCLRAAKAVAVPV